MNIGLFVFVLSVIIIIDYNKLIKEPFYSYFPPSNCMENVFGQMSCYPPFYFSFYLLHR